MGYDQECGLVVLDPSGVAVKYDQLQILSNIVGSSAARIQVVDYQQPGSSKWQRARSRTIDFREVESFDDSWKNDIVAGTKHIIKNAWVAADDAHMDAKIVVGFHPHGTGSHLSEGSGCGLQRLVKSRLMATQGCFRDSANYAFWFQLGVALRRYTTPAQTDGFV